LFLLVLLVLILFSVQSKSTVNALAAQSEQNEQAQSDGEKLKGIIDSAKETLFWDMRNFPGIDRHRPRIISYPPTVEKVLQILKKLADIEYKKLSKSDYVDFMLLSHYIFSVFEENRILKQHENDPRIYLPSFRGIHFKYSVKLETRFIYYALNQLQHLSRYFNAAKKYLKSPYDAFLNEAIESMKSHLNFLNKTLPYSLMDNFDKIRAESWQNILYKSVKDAEDFLEFLQSLKPKAVKLTDAEKLKRENLKILHKFRYRHLMPETPKQLLQFANDEYKKIDSKMKSVSVKIRGDENWHAVIEDMKNNSPKESEILGITEKYFEQAKEIITNSGVFPLSKRIYDVKVEKYEVKGNQKNMPYAFYSPLGRKVGQRGKYMLALPGKDVPDDIRRQKIRDFYKERLKIITVHECFPGHHLQISWALDIERSFIKSRLGHSTVYVEGWGLYSEQIMGELGFYDGLKGELAMLKMRLWRAARVIIDVSRHFFGMTEEEAIKLLTDKILLEKVNAEAEARRYFGNPTQPTSYLYGWREINRLRSKMMESQAFAGEEFSLFDFHKAFLDSPYTPVYLLWATMFNEYREPLFDLKEFSRRSLEKKGA
ncbi:MAG: DUF885 domain-containing protein, partial [Planctomycetes bacterium]|nr:DUF885 domain-containing protein [Planctomycetota bacterium]